MPPAPSCDTISYGPSLVPAESDILDPSFFGWGVIVVWIAHGAKRFGLAGRMRKAERKVRGGYAEAAKALPQVRQFGNSAVRQCSRRLCRYARGARHASGGGFRRRRSEEHTSE